MTNEDHELNPKDRVFGMLRFIEQLIDSGDSLDARRYEIARNVKNCLSWESELLGIGVADQVVVGLHA